MEIRILVLLFSLAIFIPSTSLHAAEPLNVEKSEKACAAKDMQGCGDLSFIQFQAGNKEEAGRLSKIACEGGNMRGCNVQGLVAKATGNGSAARRFFQQSCEAKDMPGCFQLAALALEQGDQSDAKKFSALACEGGMMLGCALQGEVENKQGNKAEAKSLFKKSCDAGEMLGCSMLGAMEHVDGNKPEAERLLKVACDGGISESCTSLEGILNERIRLYQQACNSGDMSGCFSHGVAREALWKVSASSVFGGVDSVFNSYQQACNGGEGRGCDAIKNLLLLVCSQNRANQDQDCYSTVTNRQNSGVTYVKMVRKRSESCDLRLKEAESGLGCSGVGDYEAKQGNFEAAERIYVDGCTGSNNSGCGGLACMGFLKLSQGKETEAKKYFKVACDNSKIRTNASQGYDSEAYKGCTALPGQYQKQKEYSKRLKDIRDQGGELAECKRKWKSARGPSMKEAN